MDEIPIGRVLPLLLRDVHPPDRLVPVAHCCAAAACRSRDVALQVLPVLLLRDAIHAHGRILAEPVVGAPQRLPHRCRCASEKNRLSGRASLAPLPSEVPVTCSRPSMLALHVSLLKFALDTGRLCSAGSGATRSPTSSLLCSPPTPSSPSASAPVSLAFGLPRGGRLLLCGAACFAAPAATRVPPRTRAASGGGHRVPVAPVSLVDRRGSPRLLGRPLRACRGQAPRRVRRSLALAAGSAVAFRLVQPLGTRDPVIFSRLHTRRPTRSRAYASPSTVAGDRCKARYRPAGLGLGRAGFAPAGRRTEFHELIAAPSFLTSIAWSQPPRLPRGGLKTADEERSQHRGRPLRGDGVARTVEVAALSDGRANMQSMVFTLRARVRGGRLVLDEPIHLPEGSEVDLVLADEQDDLDEEDRARLHAALDRARAQVQRGETFSNDEFLARLRAQG